MRFSFIKFYKQFYYIFVNFDTNLYNLDIKLYLKEQVKTLLAQEDLKIKELASMIEEYTGKKCSAPSLSQKLNRGTMTYNDVVNIAELLGYELKFIKGSDLTK